jgi:hypothetical protein
MLVALSRRQNPCSRPIRVADNHDLVDRKGEDSPAR